MSKTKTGLRAGVLAVVSSLALISLAATPSYAAAETLKPENEIKGATITVDPVSRSGADVDGRGTSALIWGPNIFINQGCPDGYREASRTFIVTPQGTATASAVRRSAVDNGEFGLAPGSNKMVLTGLEAAVWGELPPTAIADGVNKLVITCESENWSNNAPIGDAKYFLSYLTVDRASHTWTWSAADPASGGSEATATGLGVSDLTATSAKLTATVTPAAASGEVVFKHRENELGRAAVSGGVASITATLPAATSFPAGAITAEFTPTDPDAFVASTGQAPAFSTAAASGTIGIGGSVPAASDPGVPSGLKLQIASGDVKLQSTQARVSGQSWTASGDTPNITVLDDRRNASAQAWTLNGRSSKFIDGAKEIAAAQLGWTPALVSAAETANLAAVVTGGVEGGLSTDKALATGPTPTTGVDVSAAVKANLALVVPSTAEAGQNYTATLTLTLI